MAEATRDRVRAAIDELGFVRNESARRLRQGPHPAGPSGDAAAGGRSGNAAGDGSANGSVTVARGGAGAASGTGRRENRLAFGVIVEDLTNPYASDVARGAELALNEAGHDALWISSDNSSAKEGRSLDLLEEHRVAGALIIPVGLGPRRIAELRTAGLSVVLIDRDATDACTARVDHVAGGEIAAAHLLGAGCVRVTFVTGRPEPTPCVHRRDGASRTLVEAGLDEPPVLVQGALSITQGRAAAERILAMSPRPDGVFCANDLLAIGLINELTRLGVRVPADIAVIGYDDIELAASAAVPITTIRQPRREIGWEAAELALAEIREGSSHQHRQVVLRPELVVRDSA
ncbi:LacI family transcriptional regulator [Actinomadura algeriensis]|uniref:LacI family transcriptional regulator n=1 Tax=Actinomadura algeriensis TaxID=1679523 RepID=A0ABR9JRD3_9ACTN|nr:LacI family transcriptional regulator [Actinomadura algeriensis]